MSAPAGLPGFPDGEHRALFLDRGETVREGCWCPLGRDHALGVAVPGGEGRPPQCVPHTGRPGAYQETAAQALFVAGRKTVQPWEWISTNCGTPMCLDASHMVLTKPIKLAYPPAVCVYCGCPGFTRDHLLPRTMTGNAVRKYVATVPACGQCNSIINDRGSASITVRRRIAHEGIARINARKLATVTFTPMELAELGRTLRAHVIGAMEAKLDTLARLTWPTDPAYDLRALELSGIEDPYATGLLGEVVSDFDDNKFIEGRLKKRDEILKVEDPNIGRKVRLLAEQMNGHWLVMILEDPDDPNRRGSEYLLSERSIRSTWRRRATDGTRRGVA